jgi:hypothetical protein
MTRKDFELIAAALKEAADGISQQAHKYLTERLADALATTNPNFKRERFLRASGVQL